jgi:hypothetical protein
LEYEKLKIKTVRFPCEVCGNYKVVSSIQVFFRKNGEVSYARARHYKADKKFYYHQQSLEYTNRKLGELANTDHSQAFNSKSIDQPSQVNLQNSTKDGCNNLKLSLDNGNTRNIVCGRRLVWFRTLAFQAQKDNIDLVKYREFLDSKYRSRVYASTIFGYTLRFYDAYANPSIIQTVPSTIRHNVLKAMIALSKFKGEYLEFHQKIKQYDIKWISQDSFTSFLKIFNNNHDSLLQWYKDVSKIMKPNEQLWLRYLALSGLRCTEAELSFNRIIELGKDRKSEYINELGIVEHFRFPKDFLRGTKNCYITIVPANLLEEIIESQKLCYSTIRKRLEHNGFNQRFKELRSFYSSFMAKNGLMSEEIDLLQGRVPKSVFARHYLKENIGEFKSRVLEGSSKLNQLLENEILKSNNSQSIKTSNGYLFKE